MCTSYQAQTREIVDQVREWPVEARRELAHDILSTVEPSTNGPRSKSIKDLAGLMRTADSPPDDAECRAILEDELIRKHLR